MRLKMRVWEAITVGLLIGPISYPLVAKDDGLFRPGTIASQYDLQPPKQSDDPTSAVFAVEARLKLHKFEGGFADGNVALVIHGGPCGANADTWPGLSSLASSYRIIYYHQRGCGRSDGRFTPDTHLTYVQNMMNLHNSLGLGSQVADIERIRRILGKDRITLIGHSFGGFLASLYAAEFPEHVDNMVLVSPANMVVFPPKEDIYLLVERHLPSSLHEAFRAYRQRFFDFGALFQKTSAELDALHREFLKYYVIAQQTKFPQLALPRSASYAIGWMPFAIYFGLGRTHDYRQHLSRTKAATLVIHGEKDLQSESSSKDFCKYIFGKCTFTPIADASHFSFIENPEAFASIVKRFLAARD